MKQEKVVETIQHELCPDDDHFLLEWKESGEMNEENFHLMWFCVVKNSIQHRYPRFLP